jgi:flagellar protein FlgJ
MNDIEKIGDRTVIQHPPKPLRMDPAKEKQLRKACSEFEAMLTFNLLKTMRRTIPAGGAFPRSASRDSYEMMLDQHIADAVSRKGQGMGMQKVLFDQLSKQHRKIDSSSLENASIKMAEPTTTDR